MNKLPGGEEIHRLRTEQELPLSRIADRYGASRQAVHKTYKRWAEKNDVNWRTRPARNPE